MPREDLGRIAAGLLHFPIESEEARHRVPRCSAAASALANAKARHCCRLNCRMQVLRAGDGHPGLAEPAAGGGFGGGRSVDGEGDARVPVEEGGEVARRDLRRGGREEAEED